MRDDIPSASNILIRSCVGIGIVKPFLLKSCDDDSRNVTGRRADAALFSQRAHPAQYEPLTWLKFDAHPAHLNLNTHIRWLDKQPLASTCAELQAQVDAFDRLYNTERGHQALAGRITPQQAWDATPVAEPPRPAPQPIDPEIPEPAHDSGLAGLPAQEGITDLSVLWEATATHKTTPDTPSHPPKITGSIHHPEPTGNQPIRVYSNGVVHFAGTLFSVTRVMASRIIIADWTPDRIIFATTVGEIIAEYAWPPTGTKYQSISTARYRFQNQPKQP